MKLRGITINNEFGEFIRYLNDGNVQLILFMRRDLLKRLIGVMKRMRNETILETLENLIEIYEDDVVYGLYVDEDIGEE